MAEKWNKLAQIKWPTAAPLFNLRRVELDAKKGSQRLNNTKKHAFRNDYIEVFHPEILQFFQAQMKYQNQSSYSFYVSRINLKESKPMAKFIRLEEPNALTCMKTSRNMPRCMKVLENDS